MTTTTPATGCGGDGCTSRDPWPLHHLRHRGLRCTSCVLRYHRGAFCSACFDLLPSSNPPVARCSKCPATAHLSCIPNPDDDDYLCPSCESLNPFSYFPADDPAAGRRRSIDLASAKVLLAAAQLAAKSMTRASAVARAEAERKVCEATLARKRARETLDRALAISKAATEAVPPKKKLPRTGASVPAAAALPVQERHGEKRYQFQEPVQNDSKDRFSTTLPNHVKQEQGEREINGLLLPSSQDFTDVKDVERGFAAEQDNGSRTHQGAAVPRTNNRGTPMRVPSTTSLHS